MKVHTGRFRVMIALLIAGSAISLMSLSSCGGTKKAPPMNDESLIARTVDSMVWLTTKNGKTTNLFKAPLMEDHAFAKAAFQEYRKGIEVIGYDSLEQPSSLIMADYALHWTERDLWELKGNVVVTGETGRKLTTQQLMWDVKLKKIYSNVDSRVEEGDDVLFPERFEAADDFSSWTFSSLKGKVSIDVDPSADSTAVSSPTGSPVADSTAVAPPAVESAAAQASSAQQSDEPAATTDRLLPRPRVVRGERGVRGESGESGERGVRGEQTENEPQQHITETATTP